MRISKNSSRRVDYAPPTTNYIARFCQCQTQCRTQSRPVMAALFTIFWLWHALSTTGAAQAQGQAASSAESHYAIAVLISSQKDSTPQEIEAIKQFSKKRVEAVNRAGGLHGQPLKVYFLDDFRDGNETVKNVQKAIADKRLIAMVGIWNSTRGAKVVDAVGKSAIPFISEISLNVMFADYQNIFTLTRSINDELKVFKRLLSEKATRVAFVGLEGDLYTKSFYGALNDLSGKLTVASTHWIPKDAEFNEQRIAPIIKAIKDGGADFICLSTGSARAEALLDKLAAAGVAVSGFVALGTIGRILEINPKLAYRGSLYDIAEGGIPNVNNERLEQLVRRADFDLSSFGFGAYAIGYGARYGDLISMIAKSAANSEKTDVPSLRDAVASGLRLLAEGKRVFRGWSQDWSFAADRASAENSLLVWSPPSYQGFVLAPVQYLRSGQGLKEVPVIYLNLDMVRIFRVDSNDKSFHAEFYISIKSDKDIDIKNIEFTNAYRGQLSNQPLISVRQIHGGGADSQFDPDLKVFKVSGKFMFRPDLRTYPFDSQRFSISFQPASTSSPFFIQPPRADIRDKDFEIDGWDLEGQYVGSNQDIITTIRDYVGEERIIPFYKFNYTWVVKRRAVDYYLRVVFPLAFILLVAYFSIFIPDSRFESVVAIQVTALLSSIALYLAIPKPESDSATLSDEIFVFTYMVISLMIGLSILRVNASIRNIPTFGIIVAFFQSFFLPVIAALMITYVVAMSSAEGAIKKSWHLVVIDYIGEQASTLSERATKYF